MTRDRDFVRRDLSVSVVIIDKSPPAPDLVEVTKEDILGLATVSGPRVLEDKFDEDCVDEDD